jgi:hypothetical protein
MNRAGDGEEHAEHEEGSGRFLAAWSAIDLVICVEGKAAMMTGHLRLLRTVIPRLQSTLWRDQHLSQRPFLQARKRGGQFFEWVDMIDQWLYAGSLHGGHDRTPGGAAFGVGVGADGYSANAEPAE